jgi:hypothetical protein
MEHFKDPWHEEHIVWPDLLEVLAQMQKTLNIRNSRPCTEGQIVVCKPSHNMVERNEGEKNLAGLKVKDLSCCFNIGNKVIMG